MCVLVSLFRMEFILQFLPRCVRFIEAVFIFLSDTLVGFFIYFYTATNYILPDTRWNNQQQQQEDE